MSDICTVHEGDKGFLQGLSGQTGHEHSKVYKVEENVFDEIYYSATGFRIPAEKRGEYSFICVISRQCNVP